MSVDAMRWIDRWVGIPLCFLLTLVLFLVRPLMRAPAPGELPRRILFLELSEMGSTILADPAMRKAKGVFGADLYFAIFARNRASLDLLGTVPSANIRTIRTDSFVALTLDTLAFLGWCRRERIDTVVDLELFSRFTALLTGLSGAMRRAGFFRFHSEGLYRGRLITHRVAYNPHIHIAKNYIALVNALIAAAPEVPYSKTAIADEEIRLPVLVAGGREAEAMTARVATVYAPFDADKNRIVLINPNASDLLPHRRWPAEHFAALARRMLERWDDIVILITGAPEEAAAAEALRQRVGHARMVNFAGRTGLAELPRLYSIAALMVTNDSGPAHFASITDMPTVVLFGPETPLLYAPLGRARTLSAGLACSPCVSAANHRRTACTQAVCMTALAPEQVLAAAAEVLDSPA